MLNFFLRKLLLIPGFLLIIHFASFAYANIANQAQRASNPWGSAVNGPIPILPSYLNYISGLIKFDLGALPGNAGTVADALAQSSIASLGLLTLSFSLSLVFGILLGLAAVQTHPAKVTRWLTPLSTLGLALPGFYLATLFIIANLYYSRLTGEAVLLPVAGYGWDEHLILPCLALMIRPTAQIAQSTAQRLVSELDKQYITGARAIGNTWNSARRKHALRNILAPLAFVVSSSFRWMMAELVLVEWIFNWPGLGRLLAFVLIPPKTASPGSFGSTSALFLFPPLLSTLITLFTFVFLISDLIASIFAHRIDPLSASQEHPEASIG